MPCYLGDFCPSSVSASGHCAPFIRVPKRRLGWEEVTRENYFSGFIFLGSLLL